MAKDEKKKINIGKLSKLANSLQTNLNNLYRGTYNADVSNRNQLQLLKTDISNSIKSIMDTNTGNTGEPNISKLYDRLFLKAQNNSSIVREFEKIFGDNDFVNNIANSYLDNRWVKAMNDEIDEVLRYMPKLEEALQTIRDNVLSSDSFSKDFLNLESKIGTNNAEFASNIEELKDKYDLLNLVNDIYYEISKYGEVFVYCVPYTKAIQRLMDNKHNTYTTNFKVNYTEGTILMESSTGRGTENIKFADRITSNESGDFDINVQFSDGLIESVVKDTKLVNDKIKIARSKSLTEQYLNEFTTIDVGNNGRTNYGFSNTFDNDIEMGAKLPVHHNFDHTLPDNLELPANEKDVSSDGLINTNKKQKIDEINGCIVKKLKRECVTPIILNDVCLGYYFFEFDNNAGIFDERYTTTGMVNTITGMMNINRGENFDAMQRREELLRTVAAQLANKIDATFVNANQDLKKEIYYILKYNDDFNQAAALHNNIKVTYVPPEDMFHMYFKLDEDSGRGISDLKLSLLPAKLYVAIYVTNCLGVMTRGTDKRVYYVRQSVDTNISKTLLKCISEIKKNNFNIRQVENINSVLNITGRFNDYIIPRGSDGQSPVDMEVLQGQNIEIKTELLNLLEEAAINVTGVPIEIIQNRQSPDYAMQLTMSNSKFLRFVYRRQAVFQKVIEKFLTKIYDIEFRCNDTIKLILPPPLFINVTNTNQLIVNTSEYCNNVVETVMAGEQDDTLKALVNKNLKIKWLASYLKMDEIEDIINKSKQELALLNTINNAGNGEE